MLFLFLFITVSAAVTSLTPIVECTIRNNLECYARFGYVNHGGLIFIPVGINNHFSLSATFSPSQIVRFEPGRHERIFQASWDCARGPIVWTLNDGNQIRTVTAVHVGTCLCGKDCLAGTSIQVNPGAMSYHLTGGKCEVSHVVFDLPNCIIENGESSTGPCTMNYSNPIKFSRSNFQIEIEGPHTTKLSQVTVKGGNECASCETLVPICTPKFNDRSHSIAKTHQTDQSYLTTERSDQTNSSVISTTNIDSTFLNNQKTTIQTSTFSDKQKTTFLSKEDTTTTTTTTTSTVTATTTTTTTTTAAAATTASS